MEKPEKQENIRVLFHVPKNLRVFLHVRSPRADNPAQIRSGSAYAMPARRDLERYYRTLQDEMPAIRQLGLTQAEWTELAEALKPFLALGSDERVHDFTAAEVNQRQLWKQLPALVPEIDKLANLGVIAGLAIVDAIEQLYLAHPGRPTAAALRAVGLM